MRHIMKGRIKAVISLLLTFSLVLGVSSYALAAEAPSEAIRDIATYYDESRGVTVTMEVISCEPADDSEAIAKNGKDEFRVVTMDVYENDVFSHTIYVNPYQNVIQFTYADGEIVAQAMSDVVTITDVEVSETMSQENIASEFISAASATDYVSDEPFTISSTGVQTALSGTVYSGYTAMGYRGGYSYATSTYGYLQRLNSGISGTYYAKNFSFSAGTALSAAVSAIIAVLSVGGLTSAIISVLVTALGITYDYAYSTTFQVNEYRWDYRVRLNSNTGTIIYTAYRMHDYFKMYSSTTGVASYKYRGSAYDTGFSQSNDTLIKAAIDKYLEG